MKTRTDYWPHPLQRVGPPTPETCRAGFSPPVFDGVVNHALHFQSSVESSGCYATPAKDENYNRRKGPENKPQISQIAQIKCAVSNLCNL
jgi:hypothetical protein